MNKPSLFYNLGVCAFKTAKYSQANDAFLSLANNEKMAPLAHYNLGLVALKSDDLATAKTWFQKAAQQKTNNKVQILANEALDRLNGKEISQLSPTLKYYSFALGYDDNVQLSSGGDPVVTSEQGDSYGEVFGFFKKPLYEQGEKQLRLQSSILFQKYIDLNEFDLGSINAGLFYRLPFGDWTLISEGEYTYTIQDGKSFEQATSASIRLQRYIGPDASIRFRYSLTYFDMLDMAYNTSDGWRHRLEGKSVLDKQKWRLYADYMFEENDRDHGDYSPTRHRLRGGISYYPLKGWELYAAASYRKSNYDLIGDPDREDEQRMYNCSIIHDFNKGWSLILDHQYTDNNSNYSTYTYLRNVSSITLSRSF